MTRVRLGAVGYLNARPHVFGLDRAPRFTLRFDVPSKCAELLHGGEVDAGLIPSIEYLRGSYAVVPEIAIASRGPVSSVMLYTTRPMAEVRSIALDTSSGIGGAGASLPGRSIFSGFDHSPVSNRCWRTTTRR
jgi:chorismate dehydratase